MILHVFAHPRQSRYDIDTVIAQMGRIAGMVTAVTRRRSPLQQELDRLSKLLGLMAALAVIVIVGVGLARGLEVDDVLVLASQSLPRRFTDALEPWDLSALEPYQPSYLAGFRAEGYQIDLRNAFDLARQKMDAVIRRDIKFDIGGDRQRVEDVATRLSDMTFKHVLVPVWIAAYKFRGRSFRFVVNGQTGQVTGERPWSAWKIAFAVIAGLIVAAIAGYLYAQGQVR